MTQLMLVMKNITKLLSYPYLQHNLVRKPFAVLTPSDLTHFRTALPPQNVVTDPEQLAPHNICWRKLDRGQSTLMLLPNSTEQVSSILRYCNERGLAVVPQGGNTGLVGGSVPVFDEVIVNMKLMNKIEQFSEVSAVVSCEAGVILEKLNTHVLQYGFQIPLDLGAKGSCQIGGNASTNAGGKYVIKYGSFRSNILGIEAVLPDGKILDLRSQIHKDNTGYDLKQLFISGEGTLGIITKLNIHCKKADTNRRIMVVKTDKYEQILNALPILRRNAGKNLNALQYLDGLTYAVVSRHLKINIFDKVAPEDHLLFIELTLEDIDTLYEALPEFNDSIISQNDSQFNSIWKVREDVAVAAAAQPGKILAYDLSFDVQQWPKMIEQIRKATGVPVLGYGHIGDGNLHVNICLSEGATFTDDSMFREVCRRKGSISAEHGVGLHKPQFLKLQKSEVTLDLYRKIKQIFDPKGIMNPYKVIPEER